MAARELSASEAAQLFCAHFFLFVHSRWFCFALFCSLSASIFSLLFPKSRLLKGGTTTACYYASIHKDATNILVDIIGEGCKERFVFCVTESVALSDARLHPSCFSHVFR